MSDLYIEFESNMAFAGLELKVRRPMDDSHHRCCSGSPYLKHKNKTLMRRYYIKCGMDCERYPKVARSCDERCEERAGMTAVQVRKLPEGGSVKRNMFTRMEAVGESLDDLYVLYVGDNKREGCDRYRTYGKQSESVDKRWRAQGSRWRRRRIIESKRDSGRARQRIRRTTMRRT